MRRLGLAGLALVLLLASCKSDGTPEPEVAPPQVTTACNVYSLDADIRWCILQPCGNNSNRCSGSGAMQDAIRDSDALKFANGLATCQHHNTVSVNNTWACYNQNHDLPISTGRQIVGH